MQTLLTIRETAARLSVSPRHVNKLLASGRFPSPVRLGRAVRWRESDISEFIAADCDMGAFAARRATEPAGSKAC